MLSKNAIIYLYKPKNNSLKNAKIILNKKIGGIRSLFDDISINDDIVINRGFEHPLTLNDLEQMRLNGNIKKLDYKAKYDDNIIDISYLGYNTNSFETINNLKYTIIVNDIEFHIRPFIEFIKDDKFIIFFYIYTQDFDDSNGDKRYIKMPFHVSLFLKDMIKKEEIPETFPRKNTKDIKIMCLTTGHMHLTSDDNIKHFNIMPINGLTHTRYNRKTGNIDDINSHIYLLAPEIDDIVNIMSIHGKKIFSYWDYQPIVSNDTRKFQFFYPRKSINNWAVCRSQKTTLSPTQKYNIFHCFQNLYIIIQNIFYYLVVSYRIQGYQPNIADIRTDLNSISNQIGVELLDVSNSDYLIYIIPNVITNKNIEYVDNNSLVTKRDNKITENDIIAAEKFKFRCPGLNPRSRNYPSRGGPLPYRSRSPSLRGGPPPPPPPPRGRPTPPRGRPSPSPPRGRPPSRRGPSPPRGRPPSRR